jgi:hypothetical protein
MKIRLFSGCILSMSQELVLFSEGIGHMLYF